MKHFLFLLLISNSIWAKTVPFTIYHTNDLHSHLEGVKVKDAKEGVVQRGGFDRLKSAIDSIKAKKKNEIVIGVDAGDFFAGTIFSAIAPSSLNEFPEFQFFIDNNFDVVTLGNHEFDARNIGLEKMLTKASTMKAQTHLVASNIIINNSQSTLNKFIGNNSLIKDVLIKDFSIGEDKLRVAFLGLLGPDACLVSQGTRGDVSFIGFNDKKSKIDIKALVNFFNSKIEQVKKDSKVDVVIISMHGGGEEAEEIVRQLKGVNIVIAGHTHQIERKIIDGKILSQTGDYGQNLGVLELNFDTDTKQVRLENNNSSALVRIDNTIPSDSVWKKKIARWKELSMAKLGIASANQDDVVFVAERDFIRESKIQNELGVMLSSRLLEELNNEGVNADFYFTSMGLIRDSIRKDIPYTRSDIFEIVGIGFDESLVPGINTVSFYLTVKEVKSIVNFMELYSHISKNFAPVFSKNLSFGINKYGIPFINRIKDLKLNGKSIDDENRLIKVATNKFIIDNLATVEKASHGLVKIDPKNERGESIRTYPKYKKEYELLIESFLKK